MMVVEKRVANEAGEYKMDVEVVSQNKKSGKLVFILKGASPAFANMLRKIIVDEVPTMAIETVEFKKNSSVLYDEIIAHRLGLLTLKTDLDSYMVKKDCKCDGEGCSRCELKLFLKQKTGGTVYASDIESKDPKVVPIFDKTPIVKLGKGQNLEFEATAVLGRGKDHVKWSPGLVYYTYEPIITVNNSSAKLKEYKSKFPPQVLDKSGKVDKKRIIDLNLVDACAGVCDDVVKVEYNDESFIFYIESWGQLSPREMVEEAIKIVKSKSEELTKQLK